MDSWFRTVESVLRHLARWQARGLGTARNRAKCPIFPTIGSPGASQTEYTRLGALLPPDAGGRRRHPRSFY